MSARPTRRRSPWSAPAWHSLALARFMESAWDGRDGGHGLAGVGGAGYSGLETAEHRGPRALHELGLSGRVDARRPGNRQPDGRKGQRSLSYSACRLKDLPRRMCTSAGWHTLGESEGYGHAPPDSHTATV